MNNRKISSKSFIITGIMALLCFGVIAWGVYFGANWLEAFDHTLISLIQNHVSSGQTAIISIITELGNIRLVVVLTVGIVLFLFWKRRYIEGLWLGGTILVCAVIIGKILKVVFDRDRPQILQLVEKTGESFPSGHSLATTIFYGLFGLVAIILLSKPWQKILVGIVTLTWIVFILATRVYLGVHFPSDALGGFLYGLAVIFISIGVYLPAQQPLRKLLKRMNLHDESKVFTAERDYER